MTPQKIPGVVIHLTDFGEADKIVTFYSQNLGQWSGIAKGAKRSYKRFVNKLELFSLLDIDYSDQYSLPLINQAELVNSHLPLRQNYSAYTAAALVCELYRTWTHANDHDPELFALLAWVLEQLSRCQSITETMALFLVKFYNRLGYQPILSGCATCQQLEYRGSPFHFKASHGVIVCRQCQTSPPSVPLSLSTVKSLSMAMDLPMDKLARLRFTPASAREAIALFKTYDRTLLDRENPSWNFITS